MALPLLGLVGLGAAAALAPHAQNYGRAVTEAGRGRRQRRVLGDLLTDPNATQADIVRASVGGGLLGVESLVDQQNADRRFGLDQGLLQVNQQNAETNRLNAQTSQGRLALGERQQNFAERQYFDQLVPTVDGPVNIGTALGQLIHQESGGNPGAESHKGARGLGQIMPANIAPWARQVGLAGDGMSDAEIRAEYDRNPEFQQELAARKFGSYVQGLPGSPGGLRDAFTKWHAGEGTSWQDVVADYERAQRTGGTGRYHDGNMHTYEYVQAQMSGYARREQQRQYDIAQQQPDVVEARTRGQGWLEMDQPERMEVLRTESAVPIMTDAIDYIARTNAADRLSNPAETARIDAAWQSTVIPLFARMTGAGAMQPSEQELFESWGGRGFGNFNLTDAEQSKMEAALYQAQNYLDDLYRSNGIGPGPSTPVQAAREGLRQGEAPRGDGAPEPAPAPAPAPPPAAPRLPRGSSRRRNR